MAHGLVVLGLVAMALTGATAYPFGSKFAGDGTYYGYRDRGFGHCSFHFHRFGGSPGYMGTPLAINAQQYSGASLCGLCVRYRGVGQGLGGNPISTAWQPGFICDECPECKYGDLDLQRGGDGRWRIEWEPVQCPVGGSNFKFGFQGGNPWYKKIMVANARVPVEAVSIKRNGGWVPLTRTIDNYAEYHGPVGEAWNDGGCAWLKVRSILGDEVEDKVCCTSGTCDGGAQFPCRSDMAGDCSGAKPSDDGSGGGSGGERNANLRYATGKKQLGEGTQCGGKGFVCSSAGKDQCKDKPFSAAKCADGLKCVRNDSRWWGCKKI